MAIKIINLMARLKPDYSFELKYYNKVRTYKSKISATKIEISNPNLI
jgi:hypothetical protein